MCTSRRRSLSAVTKAPAKRSRAASGRRASAGPRRGFVAARAHRAAPRGDKEAAFTEVTALGLPVAGAAVGRALDGGRLPCRRVDLAMLPAKPRGIADAQRRGGAARPAGPGFEVGLDLRMRRVTEAGIGAEVTVEPAHDPPPGARAEQRGRVGDVAAAALGLVGGVVHRVAMVAPPGPYRRASQCRRSLPSTRCRRTTFVCDRRAWFVPIV